MVTNTQEIGSFQKEKMAIEARFWPLLLSICLCLVCTLSLSAQISFVAEAPSSVAKNEQFQIRFTLKNADGTHFSPPNFDGLNILFPPENAVSRMSINGKKSLTYTGTFMAQGEGSVHIGSASIVVNGKKYHSKPVTIKVLPADTKRGSASEKAQGLGKNDIFIRAIPSKKSVFLQEPSLIVFKLYSKTDRIQFEKVKFPEPEGFIEEDAPIANMGQLELEHYNGQNYYTAVLKKTLIFPQSSGQLTIPAGDFTIQAVVEQEIDDIDSFFGMSSIPMVERSIHSPALPMEVKPFPAGAPSSFSNAVGDFTINAEISDPENIHTGEIATLQVTIEGSGNIKLVAEPEVQFPENFEKYDTKSSFIVDAVSDNIQGKKIFEYNILPHNTGKYTIPPIEFSFLNPATGKYITKKTAPITFSVKKGEGVSGSSNDSDLPGNDIGNIIPFTAHGTTFPYFMKSVWAWVPIILIVILAILAFFIITKAQHRKADVVGTKRRKAGKIIHNIFSELEKKIQEGDTQYVYSHLSSVVYKYLSDKLTIPAHRLNRATLKEKLLEKGYEASFTDRLLEHIQFCESIAFSQATSSVDPHVLLNETKHFVIELERRKA